MLRKYEWKLQAENKNSGNLPDGLENKLQFIIFLFRWSNRRFILRWFYGFYYYRSANFPSGDYSCQADRITRMRRVFRTGDGGGREFRMTKGMFADGELETESSQFAVTAIVGIWSATAIASSLMVINAAKRPLNQSQNIVDHRCASTVCFRRNMQAAPMAISRRETVVGHFTKSH